MNLSEKVEYRINVHHEDGSYWAEVVELPGCFAAGDTMDELWDSLTEAIGLYLSSPSAQVAVKVADHEVFAKSTELDHEVVSESVEAQVLVCS